MAILERLLALVRGLLRDPAPLPSEWIPSPVEPSPWWLGSARDFASWSRALVLEVSPPVLGHCVVAHNGFNPPVWRPTDTHGISSARSRGIRPVRLRQTMLLGLALCCLAVAPHLQAHPKQTPFRTRFPRKLIDRQGRRIRKRPTRQARGRRAGRALPPLEDGAER
jgi:hypothetical protein